MFVKGEQECLILRRIDFSPSIEMQEQGIELPTEQLVGRILSSGQLSRADRQRLKERLLDDAISEKELMMIERVIEGVRKALLDIVD